MSRRNAALTAILVLAALVSAQSGHTGKAKGPRHPFMLFVTNLRPPQGDRLVAPFSNAIFEALQREFDATSYQTVRVETIRRAESMSNHKRDLIVYTDSTDWHVKGPHLSTLVVWVRFRTGFLLGRTEIVYEPDQLKALPAMTASKIAQRIRTEFLGEVSLTGGPPNLTMTLADKLTLTPPYHVILPAGQHELISQYPGFHTRVDTVDVFPGKTTAKRVLLLPAD